MLFVFKKFSEAPNSKTVGREGILARKKYILDN